MPNALYQHQCSACGKNYIRHQSWIEPSSFKNPEEACLTTTFWCPSCDSGQALKLRMLPDLQVEVVTQCDYKTLVSESAPTWFNHSDEDEENEDSLEDVTEKKAFSLFDLD